MAVQPQQQVKVELRDDRSLVVSWSHTEPNAAVKLEYYDPSGPMIEPDETERKPCNGSAMHLEARAASQRACTVKVFSEVDGTVVARTQTTWDDEFPAAEDQCVDLCLEDLQKRGEKLSEQIQVDKKASGLIRILVLGQQHHGKSSFINHVFRVLKKDLKANDQMNTAVAGPAENTREIQKCDVAELSFLDTPAIPNMSSESVEAIRALLAGYIPEGIRRKDCANSKSSFSAPPDAAILVMSLCHWRDQPEEMQSYMVSIAKELKEASDGRVTFPYVVAATHRDEFLRTCAAEKPHEELKAVLTDMKKAANTDYVFALASYKQDSRGSSAINEQTFKLLSQLVTLAARQDTGVVVAKRWCNLMVFLSVLVTRFQQSALQRVYIEAVDSRWTDGFGIGVGLHPSRKNCLVADLGGFYEALAWESLPDCWLLGYDCRVKLGSEGR
ncbi:unnamed protein product, partial [Symbiodinium microadriaticum]